MIDARPRQLGSLIKPRIVALLCLTGVSALFAAGGTGTGRVVTFLLAGGLTAAGAAAVNCWYDRDLDQLMERTADRPLPRGDLDPWIALAFAVGLLAAGLLLGLATLPMTAVGYMALGAVAYLGLYTAILKRRHPIGVVLGGSAGSFPVLAGWTAVRPLEVQPLIMAALVFTWTPAHAWALAFVYRDDFAAASVPTLPVVADTTRVRRAVFLSAIMAVGVGGALLLFTGRVFAVAFGLTVPAVLYAFGAFYRSGTEPAAVRAFFTSNLALTILFGAWAVDGFIGVVDGPVLLAEAVAVSVSYAWLWRARPRLRGVRAAAVGWTVPPFDRPEGRGPVGDRSR